CMQAVEFPWTF
nr:immunoglobulin light chain junction region [Macaca mulatta]MOX47936.1 immunoglobulin light chain junction region [Macaca mulatta]MOX48085.1 immunoglobulin light chain junction region [Macaca mulatta]MOX48155.1 immunoglobulin light chain junction region [Macaca mulatta]MOX48170.1 immunoglobulin light chain junction region [Macaca mulatta]